jgi:hypothetical protein
MIKGLLRKVRYFFILPVLEALQAQQDTKGREFQILLALKYKEMLRNRVPLPSFDEVGFRVYSDNEEDGILLYIFSLIGMTNKKVVDIGSGTVQGSNSANLIINHGWVGLLIDGNERAVEAARSFYSACPDTKNYPPPLVHAWVTAENINAIISEHGFAGEIDLLSIDIDGIDYWIWKAIDSIHPRVVVVEYQDIIGPDKALAVAYRPDFKRSDYDVNARDPLYAGASLPAFVKLGKQKGYRLVGCNRYGYNAFFVRSDLGAECLPQVPVESCFKHPWNVYGMENLLLKVQDMDWVEV